MEPLDKVISESWDRIEIISRVINPYRAEEYFVLQEEDTFYDVALQGIKCDGSVI
jgi:hypothetical protein